MPTVITTQPTVAQRRAREVGRVALTVLAVALHLVVAVVVLGVRIPYTVLGMAARTAARAELALSARTGREPLGQTAGVALAAAFAMEFRTSLKATTH